MDALSRTMRREEACRAHNEEFVRRLNAQRPHLKAKYEKLMAEAEGMYGAVPKVARSAVTKEGVEILAPSIPVIREMVAETIVWPERPILFIKNDCIDVEDKSPSTARRAGFGPEGTRGGVLAEATGPYAELPTPAQVGRFPLGSWRRQHADGKQRILVIDGETE